MSKFLKLVRENTPGDDAIEVLYKLKEILGLGSKIDTSKGRDLLIVPLGDGRTATVELVDIARAESEEADAIEDQEMQVNGGEMTKMKNLGKALKAAEEVTGINDPSKRMLALSNPKKNVEKAVGDVYNKIAKNLQSFARDI